MVRVRSTMAAAESFSPARRSSESATFILAARAVTRLLIVSGIMFGGGGLLKGYGQRLNVILICG
jgi:hypothetical protein